ncbi:MAG: glycerophosphodiester phosphodiesterase [Proteobacteria bacterium]|nr:glycerophosphodiester phosphodiesterase [Pseudomonadota bacterium]MCH8177333.1 glycerophosphodiester phosphodiesterase [Pseudomonadota bacterium]
MSLKDHIENHLQLMIDGIYAVLPQAEPDLETVKNCKIVSHRGEHGGEGIKENTLAAFDRVLQHGIWGIEFDIRWTADLQPVIIHDPDCERVFGERLTLSQVSLAELQSRVPRIPTLTQVIERYGGKIHLMAEIKEELFPNPQHQRDCLQKLFSPLTPSKDFHLLALNPDIFSLVNFVPKNALLPVAKFNIRELSDLAMRENYAGISGQYLLVNNKLVRQHGDVDQKTGTGFVRSRHCFYRELNRGITWIFTNHAVKLRNFQQILLKHHNSC